ncbi:OLC1v1038257C1 [Oldenlandia corymbosa var. corymbosa]|uniref:OLC1v1038257C1 n=1 Tax=Oldenlandia corymbosa var. corymbosa TaxID=529605 RepID=A0AAV1D001_OLDCO|nr:OLC1v1038257C1 [Oldenlandia corymbosa var. corymbosa]
MAEAEEKKKQLPEIRKDAVNNRWVIFSPARSRRPSDFKSSKSTSSSDSNQSSANCPFCSGNEHLCAPEIFRVQPDSEPSWTIRVVQNMYPALTRADGEDSVPPPLKQTLDEDLEVVDDERIGGVGFHEVVIETPVHSVHLLDLDPVRLGDVLLAYKKRIDQLRTRNSIRYIQVFKNHGASAGASLSHSHSQLIALPILPPAVSSRLESMKHFFEQTGKCKLCEVQPKEFLINESTHFISIVPFAATFPFEVWIIPRGHSPHFHDLDNEKAVDLGGLLKLMLSKISLQLNKPPFNFMVHTSPFHFNPPCEPYMHWFLQIVPQLTSAAGFELATGCHINPIFPEDAAKVLREVQFLS